jgi:ATP-binding cassette subfamily B protein/subfamily B ATP-binding cassette protein MsbA
VGETGAGKSTIIRLISRFYEVSDGAVLVDDIDIRTVTMASLRSQMGIVLQDTFLFSGTIAENIRYGKLDAGDDEVEAAAKAVGAHDFILQFPLGYRTVVQENGGNLSVGQRQIISFARALLANPRILILDEATSSVDTATEQIIQRAMDTLMMGRNADQIVVMDQGRVVEHGAHADLLALKGRYWALYTMAWQDEADAEAQKQM